MREPVYLFRVADSFEIQDRGCVLLPGIPRELALSYRKGRLRLHHPDGTEREVFFDLELALISGKEGTREEPMCLARDVSKADVPLGTEVWFIGVRDA